MKKVIFGGALFIGGCIISLGVLISQVLSDEARIPVLCVGLIVLILGLAFGMMGIFYEDKDGKRK